MRTPQELQTLLSRLYLTQFDANKQVAEADVAGCDCRRCEMHRMAAKGLELQIDLLLYVLGADTTTKSFLDGCDAFDAYQQQQLEARYAEANAVDADFSQETRGGTTNARIN